MIKPLFLYSALFLLITTNFQSKESVEDPNLDFEVTENGILSNWENFGSSNYQLGLDSTEVQNGDYSVFIEFTEGKPDYHAWSYVLPDDYNGETITLSGYIKTENVTDGFAGLLMRIDPFLAISNMNEYGVTGTTDWTKHEISLALQPEETEQILVGGLLVGKGKMWLDNLTITIDKEGVDLTKKDRELLPAELDTAFNSSSAITDIPTNEQSLEDLKKLGLVWGFLKYHHPGIAEGLYNWDYELFRILPEYLEAKDNSSRDELLVNWIQNLGEFTEGEFINFDSSDIKLEPDFKWITESNFSNELTTLLLDIQRADRPWQHFYVDIAPDIGNPVFKNEAAYSSMIYPDEGFRLLSIFRFWNMIEYYFPYKHLIEENWEDVLEEFIPKFIEARNETEYTLAALEVIGRIHDTHANIWGGNEVLGSYKGNRYAAVELMYVEEQPVVVNYFDDVFGKETGLKIGDAITSINDQTIEEIQTQRLKYTPASNYPTQLRDLALTLLRTNDSTLTITYVRDEEAHQTTLKTYTTNDITITYRFSATDTSFRMINDDIAYINNGTLKAEDLPKIWDKIENTRGLIIDNRNYPYHFPLNDLANYLMPEPTPFVKFTNGSLESPGLFTFTEPNSVGTENPDYYKGEVIILVNEVTQSSSEYHAMAYRAHPNSTVIGSTTAAADGNISPFYLPGGIYSMISGIGVYYPDGTETQRIGIVPDIEITPTIQGIKDGRDEVLERAIQFINQD